MPIPSAGPAESTPTASPGHPAVLAIGGPVQVNLPGGASGLVTALGPEQITPARSARRSAKGYPSSTRAVITLQVAMRRGSAVIATSELSSRDETGHAVRLSPDGPEQQRVSAAKSRTVKVVGTFASGAAQVTWRHAGHVLGVWTFNIELD